MGEELLLNIGENLSQLGGKLGNWLGEHAFNILVILFGAWLLRHFSSRLISQSLRYTLRVDLYPTELDRKQRIETLDSLVGAAIKVLVYIVASVMIITEIGIDTTPLLASAGVIGVALGFGAQSLIKDFVSGIFIITENQYRVGDVVTLAGIEGKVENVTIRTTVIRDMDGNVHHIPNGTISATSNKTLGHSRINEDIVVDYKTDIKHLEHVINHVGEELAADSELGKKIVDAPRFKRIEQFGEKGLLVKIAGKTKPGKQWEVKGELLLRLKQAFEKNKIDYGGQAKK